MAEVTPLLRFFVRGEPVPQGSKRAWLNRATGKVMMAEDQGTRHRDWRAHVMHAAMEAAANTDLTEPIRDAVTVSVTFYIRRGIGHYGSGRNADKVKDSAPEYPIKPPDLDKLTRSIFDSMTDARVWLDDSQVASMLVRKRWCDRFTDAGGVDITLGILPSIKGSD